MNFIQKTQIKLVLKSYSINQCRTLVQLMFPPVNYSAQEISQSCPASPLPLTHKLHNNPTVSHLMIGFKPQPVNVPPRTLESSLPLYK